MFFHGIDLKYIEKQFPILSPRRSVSEKNEEQRLDRKHLMQKFGFEPIHLLEANSREYSVRRCIRECLKFGNVVLAFDTLPLPIWQISRREIGVPVLDVRACCWLTLQDSSLISEVRRLFPGKRFIVDP